MQDLLLSEYADGRRDFRGLNLCNLSLPPGADLSDADFSNANLHGAKLRGANLAGCRFCGANFGAVGLRRIVAAFLAIVAGASFAGIAIAVLGILGAFSPVGVGVSVVALFFVAAFYGFGGRFGLGRLVYGAAGWATLGLALLAVMLGLIVLRERWTAWREFWSVGEISFRLGVGVVSGLCLMGASLWAIAFVQVAAVAVARWPTAICMAIATLATGATAIGVFVDSTATWFVALAIAAIAIPAAFLSLNGRLVNQAAAGRQRALRELVLRLNGFGAADLRGANLAGADFSGADLRGVDLRGARLAGVSWQSGRHVARGLVWARSDEPASVLMAGATESTQSIEPEDRDAPV